jgi:RimJ/RimL family protein N-acetyltransferase
MTSLPSFIEIENDEMRIVANLVEWDTVVFDRRVAAISEFSLKANARWADLTEFYQWVADNNYEIVSCRLPHHKLNESICLESYGFRFVEMVLHPFVVGLDRFPPPTERLIVKEATENELSIVGDIAGRAFGFERYHIDPRVDSHLADLRYRRWALSSFKDQAQKLVTVVTADRQVIAFFIYEILPEYSIRWLLTAMIKSFQGRGLGYQTWLAMIMHHKNQGFKRILTTISARNCPVLNVYSKLGFKFEPPEMTFHWVREK